MAYRQALNYLNSFVNYERLNLYPDRSYFKLERVEKLLQLLGNPESSLGIIHIAGTKGKGSSCAFVANILSAAGFKVGLYTSPHLIDARERIRVLKPQTSNLHSEDGQISKKDFAEIIGRIKPGAEKLRNTKLGRLSYFEIFTACALLYFKEQECKFVVLETGIGGKLDATNVTSSLVCAITPISYEHTHVLGRTLEKITAEKSAIIKSKTQIAVTAPQRLAALKVIRRRAQSLGVKLYEVGRDIRVKPRTIGLNGQSFDVQGIFAEYTGLKIGLLGEHQAINAALAIGCAEALSYHGFSISREAIRKGLKRTAWPGRLQIISRRPKVVLDAAHNQASCLVLRKAVDKLFKFRNLILVLGISCDKNARGILKELLPQAQRVILTRAKNPRALKPEIIKTMIKPNSRLISLTGSSAQALSLARKAADKRDLILVCGSIFLIGEVLKNTARRCKNYC